ncbi:MAG: hypothetical protein ACRC0A_01705, partial [Chitinophagaceae bacterium]
KMEYNDLSALVEITPANIVLDREIIQSIRENVLDMYSQDKIDKISLEVKELIELGNVKMVDLMYKESNDHLSNLKSLPKILGDKIKDIENKALLDVKLVTDELRLLKKEVETTLVILKEQVMNPMMNKRRDNFFETVSSPIIDKVLDEISQEKNYDKVDFSLFFLSDKDMVSFRLFSSSKKEIETYAELVIRNFAEIERAKIIEIEKIAQDEYILQLREKSLQSELNQINLNYGTNIEFNTGTSALRQGANDEQILSMWSEMAQREVINKQNREESKEIDKEEIKETNIFVRLEIELESIELKNGLFVFFERHGINFREI